MRRSAGLVLYRWRADQLEVLLAHPGGPFWARKDKGAWSIPKGEFGPDEDPLQAAMRETREELGLRVDGPPLSLGDVRLASGKVISAWAIETDFDASTLTSNTFDLEWPPGSGERRSFPEIDQAAWFDLAEAAVRINPGQRPLLDRLHEHMVHESPT